MGYAKVSELDRYFENFATLYYSSEVGKTVTIATQSILDDIEHSANKINSMLSSVNDIPIVPIGTQRNGSHNPYLIEWNCCDTIYNKLKSRHAYEYNGELPGWMMQFGSRGMQIFSDILENRITFEFNNTQSGIGFPTQVTHVGRAQLITNWDSGFYDGSDYTKTFGFKIIGTTGTEIGQSTFSISTDGGYSYPSGTQTTGTGWIDIADGLQIRWSPQSLGTTGSFRQLEINDEWTVTCVPANVTSITKGKSSFKTFSRG
jgi:hypothetical protein